MTVGLETVVSYFPDEIAQRDDFDYLAPITPEEKIVRINHFLLSVTRYDFPHVPLLSQSSGKYEAQTGFDHRPQA